MRNAKKLTLISSLILFLLFLGCKEKEHQTEEPTVKPPEQIITVKEAQVMFDNYTNRRVPLIQTYEDSINPKEKFDVARYGYYDYKTIKNYIAFIEQEAKKANVEISTLRFYFSNYPNDTNLKHPRQNSFFILPTTMVDGKEYGFSVLSDDRGNYKAELLKNNFIIEPPTITEEASFLPKISFFKEDVEQSLIINESNISPPPYN